MPTQKLQWNLTDSRYKLSTLDEMTISLNVPVEVTARTQSFGSLANFSDAKAFFGRQKLICDILCIE